MARRFVYDWPEAEDDNFNPQNIEKAKTMTVEEIDADFKEFLKDLMPVLENV